MRIQWTRLLLSAVLLIALPRAGWAADGTAGGPEQAFRFGAQELGITVGPGFAIPVGGTDSPDLRDVRYLLVAPRWGIQVTDPLGQSWYRGTFELLLDALFHVQIEPRSGFGGGPLALFRYNFLAPGSVVPFVDAGGGIMITDFRLQDREDGFDFTYQVGVGLQYFVSPSVAITTSARFDHISNAYITGNNLGINSILFQVGVSSFFHFGR